MYQKPVITWIPNQHLDRSWTLPIVRHCSYQQFLPERGPKTCWDLHPCWLCWSSFLGPTCSSAFSYRVTAGQSPLHPSHYAKLDNLSSPRKQAPLNSQSSNLERKYLISLLHSLWLPIQQPHVSATLRLPFWSPWQN